MFEKLKIDRRCSYPTQPSQDNGWLREGVRIQVGGMVSHRVEF